MHGLDSRDLRHDSDLMVPAFAQREDHVPEINEVYRFNSAVTLATLASFTRDRPVMLQGLHGTGKSAHIATYLAVADHHSKPPISPPTIAEGLGMQP